MQHKTRQMYNTGDTHGVENKFNGKKRTKPHNNVM